MLESTETSAVGALPVPRKAVCYIEAFLLVNTAHSSAGRTAVYSGGWGGVERGV